MSEQLQPCKEELRRKETRVVVTTGVVLDSASRACHVVLSTAYVTTIPPYIKFTVVGFDCPAEREIYISSSVGMGRIDPDWRSYVCPFMILMI